MTPVEKKSFSLHLIYAIIEGCLKGCFIMNEFIFLRSMKGGTYQLGILFQLSMALLLLSVVFNEVLKRSSSKKRILIWVGIICHLPLMMVYFFPSIANPYTSNFHYQLIYMAIFFMYYLSTPLVLPTINLLLKNTYSHSNFGKFYSISSSVGRVSMLISTFVFGLVLESDNFAFRYVYPILSIIGIISIICLSFIPYESEIVTIIRKGFWGSIKESMMRMVNIIKTNKPYKDFEIGFMLYGFAFLSTSAVITIFLERYLNLNYMSVAFYKNVFNILAVILMPLFGKILHKLDPRQFALITFGSLGLYIFFIAITEYIPSHFTYLGIEVYYTLILAMISFGIFSASMPLLWNIGSAYFCESKDAGDYQSIHLSLTGIRGVFAPLFGIFFYETIGYIGTWSIALISVAASMILMIWSYKKY